MWRWTIGVVLCCALHGQTSADALMRQGKYAEARQELLHITAEHPDSVRAFCLLGTAEMQLHHAAAAEKSLRRAIELDPESADALYNLGVVLLEEKRAREAIGYFDRVKPPSPELAVNLVRAHLDADDREGALAAAESGGKQFAKSPAFHLALGNVYLRHALYQQATTSLRQAEQLAGPQPEILLPLAESCLRLRDLGCAGGALDRITPERKDAAAFHLLHGQSLFLGGQREAGLREIEAAAAREPANVDYLTTLARYVQKAGNPAAALTVWDRAARLAPDSPEIPYGTAVSYFIEDRFERAIEYSRRALKIDPAFDRALFLLGISQFARNQLAAAEQALGQTLKLRPANAYYHCFYGMLLLSEDRYPEAAASFRRAIDIAPAYALARYQLGRVLVRMRKYSEARTHLERATALQPNLGEAYYQLGLVYRKLGETAKATEALAAFQRYSTGQQNERAAILKQAQRGIEDSR